MNLTPEQKFTLREMMEYHRLKSNAAIGYEKTRNYSPIDDNINHTASYELLKEITEEL